MPRYLVLLGTALLLALGVGAARLACVPEGIPAAVVPGSGDPSSGQGGTSRSDPDAREAQDRRADGAARERAELPGPAPTHRFVGRVVDGTRRPVAGAAIELAEDGNAPLRASSDAEGRFALLAALAPETRAVSVLARDADRAACRRRIPVPALVPEHDPSEPPAVDAGTLVLLPSHRLGVRVAEAGSPVPGARLEVSLGHERRAPFEVPLDGRGEALVEHLPRGPVQLRASAPGREGRARAYVPEESHAHVELEPLGEIRVQLLDAHTERPLPGVELGVGERWRVPAALPGEEERRNPSAYLIQSSTRGLVTTDAEGQALIGGLAPGVEHRIRIRAEGYRPYPVPPDPGPRLLAGAPPAVVRLVPWSARSVRWRVVPGEVEVPANGTELELRLPPGLGRGARERPLPRAARMEGGELVVDGAVSFVDLIARAPDGALAFLWAGERDPRGPDVSFRRPRRIEVLVTDARGGPAAGVRTSIRNRNRNPLAAPRETDAAGRAAFEDLFGGTAEVLASLPGFEEPGIVLGSVDLEAGDGFVEARLLEPRRAVLALRIDGRPALPALFELRDEKRRLCEPSLEDPARGELELELLEALPGGRTRLRLVAQGFRPEWIDIALPADGSPARAEVELVPLARLVARVRPAPGEPPQIQPEILDAERGSWKRDPSAHVHEPQSFANGPDGTFVYLVHGAGRRRVVDRRSGKASTETELDEATREAEVDLDLADVAVVAGRVEIEEPGELARVRVLVQGLDAEPGAAVVPDGHGPLDGGRGMPGLDGAFRLEVPGDRELRLVPWHPWLMPAEGGTALVRGGREGVVLRLTAGDELRLVGPELAAVRAQRLRVARYAGEPEGQPLEWHVAPLVDGVARCGLPRGRWTLWIDPGPGLAPAVLRDVEVEGARELPAPRFGPGSTLRVRLAGSDGTAPPLIHVFATALEEPGYSRQAHSGSSEEAAVTGLGAGRFRVRILPLDGGVRVLEEEVELDGAEERVLQR